MLGRISNMKLRYKVGFGVATGAAVLGMAGGAFAYFTSTGNGTGSATVGQPSNWSVVKASTAGTLYPCGAAPLAAGCDTAPNTDEATITFTITNNSTGNQQLTFASLQSAIDSATGTDSNVDVVTGGTNSQPNADAAPTSNLLGAAAQNGCLASWFGSTVTSLNGATSDVDVAGKGTATVVVTVGMEDANAIQNPCKNLLPDVDLWVA